MATPHRVVDSLADGIANGARGLIGGVSGAVRGVGKSVMGALDKPFAAVTHKEGPHRVLDRAADGALDAVENLAEQGVIGTAQKAGGAVMRALDHPVEQFGVPPDIDKFSGRLFKR